MPGAARIREARRGLSADLLAAAALEAAEGLEGSGAGGAPRPRPGLDAYGSADGGLLEVALERFAVVPAAVTSFCRRAQIRTDSCQLESASCVTAAAMCTV